MDNGIYDRGDSATDADDDNGDDATDDDIDENGDSDGAMDDNGDAMAQWTTMTTKRR